MRGVPKLLILLLSSIASTPVSADIFTGSDSGASAATQLTNSNAASAAFNAEAVGTTLVNFEGPVPTGISITGGSVTSTGPLGCTALCGFNTTSGGENFLFSLAEPITFSFASPVNAFGFYVTGIQSEFVPPAAGLITFESGATTTFAIPYTVDGGAFFGVIDGKTPSIASVSINPRNDYVGFDDLRFGVVPVAVPEPATWAMMLVGFGTLGSVMRRRKATAIFARG